MATIIDPTVVKQLRTSDIIFHPESSIRYIIGSVRSDHVIVSYLDLPAMSRKISFVELIRDKWELK